MNNKTCLFFENANLLNKHLDILPLMYGSLGLEFITGHSMEADDIDILIPQPFITNRWPELRKLLENNGYTLIDEPEHTFEKNGVNYSYSYIEDLETFAGIKMEDIVVTTLNDATFKVLSLNQYLNVYTASSKDGYRINTRQKKDFEKIHFITELLKTY